MCSDDKEDTHALQQKFLKTHDEKLKKLWFLWPELNKSAGNCGCTGGCLFFGDNINGKRFFKPSYRDLDEGTNIAAFRVNEPGADPAYGQSILHEGMLIFRTTPYIVNEISLQDTEKSARLFLMGNNINSNGNNSVDRRKLTDKDRDNNKDKDQEKFNTLPSTTDRKSVDGSSASPQSLTERKNSRRYSSTSIRSREKDVPYARLVDPKLDSDSKLHKSTDKSKLLVGSENPDEPGPKNSASDSKLAVDYFSPAITQKTNENININTNINRVDSSDSQHSLGRILSDEQLQKAAEVQRTISMSSENHSEAFFSADEDMNINSRSSSLRNSVLSSNGTLTRQESSESKNKRFSSEQSINGHHNLNLTTGAAQVNNGGTMQSAHASVAIHTRSSPSGIVAPSSVQCTRKLSTHRSDHEIHTPEHRSLPIQGLITPQRQPGSLRHPSPRLVVKESTPTNFEEVEGLHDEHSSDGYSSTSYVSAVGSQEDFTLVDLHMQVNRLILDSPMLMYSYVTHLNQVRLCFFFMEIF